MNHPLQIIAAAMLLACYALPVRAEAVPKFGDYTIKVYTGKRAKPRLDHEFWRDRSETSYRGAKEDSKVNAGGRYIVVILPCGARHRHSSTSARDGSPSSSLSPTGAKCQMISSP
jgi:hypothetical protein